jgi:hypothetical protein
LNVAAKLLNLGRNVGHLGGIDDENSDIGTILGQPKGYATSNLMRRTCHERYFSVECHWGISFCFGKPREWAVAAYLYLIVKEAPLG